MSNSVNDHWKTISVFINIVKELFQNIADTKIEEIKIKYVVLEYL